MEESDVSGIIPILRRIAKALSTSRGFSEDELIKAKTLATKLYLLHSNRKISLSKEDFSLILSIVQFDMSND